MTRRLEIESIIIGTLLNSFETDWFADCGYCITADMFIDERNAKIYSAICECRKTGVKDITPHSLMGFDKTLTPLAGHMSGLAINHSFAVSKARYNEAVWLERQARAERYQYTSVQFSDYVAKFLEMVIKERRARNSSI